MLACIAEYVWAVSFDPIRVLVVEDTRVVRELLVQALTADPSITVVGVADTAAAAIELTKELRPDVVSMDVVLPDLSGVDATERIMEIAPTPVVLVTSLSSVHEDYWSMKALAKGAVMVVPKPSATTATMARYVSDIKAAASAAGALRNPRLGPPVSAIISNTPKPDLILVGCSTGGPRILTELLRDVDQNLQVPMVLVQHISADFFNSFVNWLGTITSIPIETVSSGLLPVPGVLYVAPAERHTVLGADGRLTVVDSPPVNHCRPSVTELLRSAVRWRPKHTLGLVLTGMGDDGAAGVKSLKSMGGQVLAQDSASCVVSGMPDAARGAGADTATLAQMTALLRRWSSAF